MSQNTNFEASMGLPFAHLTAEIQAYIRNISATYQVPEDMVVLAVYTATAVSVGSRVTTFDGIYTNKLSLWGILVGISGAGKTEFAAKVLEPILQRNAKLVADYEKAMSEWDGKGQEPIPYDFRLHSVTLEALVEKINQNPDGLFLYRGELSGWVSSFGKYNRDDNESATWIEVWDGKTFPIHTKSGNKKMINAKDPTLSVLGGVQPHIMKRFARADILGSGFLGRLLMVYPPLCYPTSAPIGGVDEQLLDYWAKYLDNNYLLSSQFLFSSEAKAIYDQFCYTYVRDKVMEIGEEAIDPYNVCLLEFYGKIKVYAEKWAGLSMLLAGKSGFIDGEVMTMTIEAMKVLEFYAMKVYRFTFSPMSLTTKGDLIRRVNAEFEVKNRALLAESLGVARSLISDYLNGKK